MTLIEEARLRGAIEAVLDARAFSGPFDDAGEQSLLRDLNPIVRRFIPRGARAVVEVHRSDDEDAATHGTVATVAVTIVGGTAKVQTIRLNVTGH